MYSIGISQSEEVLPKLCTDSACPFQGPKGRTIRKLIGVDGAGGGGGGKYKKIICATENAMA